MLVCSYDSAVTYMEFVWDEQKSRRNLAKHGVSFETAKLVFDDPRAVSQLDRVKDEEVTMAHIRSRRRYRDPSRRAYLS